MHENWTHCEKKANVRSCSPILFNGSLSQDFKEFGWSRKDLCLSPQQPSATMVSILQKSTRLKDCPWFLIRIGILCFGSVNYCSFPVLVIALWIVLFCVIYAHISNKLVLQYLGFPLPLFIQEYLLPTCVAWSVDSIWWPRSADTNLSLQFFFVAKIDLPNTTSEEERSRTF